MIVDLLNINLESNDNEDKIKQQSIFDIFEKFKNGFMKLGAQAVQYRYKDIHKLFAQQDTKKVEYDLSQLLNIIAKPPEK